MPTFTCAWCRRDVPWSEGCSDDMPEVCDECWCAAHGLAPSAPTEPEEPR